MSIEPISISPFIFFIIDDYISSLYSKIYNIEIFLSNNILIFMYFAIHYNGFYETIQKHGTDIIYKKYKGILFIHIIFNYIISIGFTAWFIRFIFFENGILWNILFAPFISATLSTAFDSRILRRVEKKLYNELREREYQNYTDSLIKIIEAQKIQERILNIHNKELGELSKNIAIIDEMMHLEEESSGKETKDKNDAQGRYLP